MYNILLHVACNYHYLGWVLTWKYLKQGFWGEIYIYIRGLQCSKWSDTILKIGDFSTKN
jgi:hypothetical protein